MIEEKTKLRRDLGPLSGYATIIGILVGAGIFRVTGEAGAMAGSSVPLAYLLFAPIIICTALTYSVFVSTPLGTRPGGAYIHISRTSRRCLHTYFQDLQELLPGLHCHVDETPGFYWCYLLHVHQFW